MKHEVIQEEQPKQPSNSRNVYLKDASLWAKLEKIADGDYRSVNNLIEVVLSKFVKEQLQVTKWSDISGNDQHLTQTNVAKKPNIKFDSE